MVERRTVRPRHTSGTFQPVLYNHVKVITSRERRATRTHSPTVTVELAVEKKSDAMLPALCYENETLGNNTF